ncbi:MAG: N-acetyl-gamma-glutamyl-phosphate reductase [Gammaproteobacteria bacterium]|nr:N-acetyl-gamma-glutamyl-phosphate reductase [Gammaproteobacteria bacterium]MDE2251557.1 N-acetyl-gamma-glutamyl-phosphate reductase [Gammaproteobacteria bacterium]
MSRVPTIVLGGTGYVAGELLRLIAAHPQLRLAGILSDGSPGERVAQAFPHLAAVYPDERFKPQQQIEALLQSERAPAILAAAPHGVSAQLIDTLLTTAEAAGRAPRVVDISADFRYPSAAAYEAVYRHAHGAPARIAQFSCAVPEHLRELKTAHVAHPGCFATTILLAAVPLLALDLIEPQLFVAATTGSTGSGRKPVEGTHHPVRHGDLYAYNALAHRHTAEIVACAAAASGVTANFAFVPHSGPYARGIHATVQAVLRRPLDTAALLARLADFYAQSPLVQVGAAPPRLKEVVASCYARLGAVSDGRTLAVMSVADNLNKGAAGGALQWMNRLQGFPESMGLTAAAPGWT